MFEIKIPPLSRSASMFHLTNPSLLIDFANRQDRSDIYRLRHEVYARELGQHPVNADGYLQDSLDHSNIYVVARSRDSIAGFISITPPSAKHYSIDKYLDRKRLPFEIDRSLYEIRLLTVARPFRGTDLAALLMYAAFRFVEASAGSHIAAIGRQEVVDLYRKCGLCATKIFIRCGAVNFELMHASTATIRERIEEYHGLLQRLESKIKWGLNIPFWKPAPCFHGGQFFEFVGPKFDHLERARSVVNADVLDAWFPPSPKVISGLEEHLPWLLRSSPPTSCEGLIETIAESRGIQSQDIVVGAGSSDLIFRALPRWLNAKSHALILDPTYGEYAHVLEKVIGCTVDRLRLLRRNQYEVDTDRLAAALNDRYDLVVLVNPNSPTGRFLCRKQLERILLQVPPSTRVWVDETYIDFISRQESLETFAVKTRNVIVCKSMSKVYGLSGARVAYLCANPVQLEEVRSSTPPWVVGLPSQFAAVLALQDPEYYRLRYLETRDLRQRLATDLATLGIDVVPGTANFLLCHLNERGPTSATIIAKCRERGVFLRDSSGLSKSLGNHSLRIAVKDSYGNAQILNALERAFEFRSVT